MPKFIEDIKEFHSVKKLRKSKFYARFRQYFPQAEYYYDDRSKNSPGEKVLIDWPDTIKKPSIGIVRDIGMYPRWTKYCQFLENNKFQFSFYPIHSHNWIELADEYDVIVGMVSNQFSRLKETIEKYHFLEHYLEKACYPTSEQVLLYENKSMEAYIAKIYSLPYAETVISHDKEDALRIISKLRYPVISKIDPSSGSAGVDFIHTENEARKIVNTAFSGQGRKTHWTYYKQKDYVYFQNFIPNDGFDIRVVVVGNWIFGYYRKVPEGDYRASGMNLVEKRGLPEEAMKIAIMVNKIIKSPMLAVDMLHGLDGNYYIIEFSPFFQMETPEQLHLDGIAGRYIFDENDNYYFEPGKFWLDELALKEFLINTYLPKITSANQSAFLSQSTRRINYL